jgi:chromosome condensin MukBEF ATPase and DNA-binding subunit MukB
MKKTILIPILFCATTLLAQEKNPELQKQQQEIISLTQKLNNQQVVIGQQKNELAKLTVKTEIQEKQIDSLKSKTAENDQNIQTIANDLGTKIQQTETTAKDSISKLDKNVNTNRLYWIIGTLATLLLGGILYWLLGKRIQNSKTDVETQIKNAKKSLEEESIKLDSKLIEVLDTQLKLKQEEKQIVSANSNTEIDHSLALKVADEIVRMQKNISKMDEETKGLKPLVKGIERIQANFASSGYETINLLNKDYDERMNIDVINFITDENLTAGRKIITSVIKPQVNFNGVLIQRAQVDVSQN